MEDASVKIFNVLLFLTISVHLSLAETHSLQYLYTSITAGIQYPNFTAVGLVDGEQFMYYDSNISKAVPKTEWINTCKAFTPDFWTTETQKHQSEQRDCQNLMTALMQRHNKPDGDHTLQVIHSCTLNDDMSTLESKFGYNGENVQNDANWLTVSLNNDNCIDQLKNLVFSCSEALERKVRPTASVFQKNTSSPQMVCHATGFFPKDLISSWQKDGTDVHEDVDLGQTLPNEDGTFQKRSILKVSAEELQKHTYKCVIQHSSLEKEMVLEVPKGLGSAGAVNAVYLVVFFVILLALFCGYFIWRRVKKSMGTAMEMLRLNPSRRRN